MKIYRRFLRYLRQHTILIVFTIVLSVLFVALNSLGLWMIASLVNTILVSPESIPVEPASAVAGSSILETMNMWTANLIQQATPLQTLARLCWVLLTVFVTKNLVFYFKNFIAGVVENRLIRDLRNDLFTHIQSLSLSNFAQQRSAELTSIILNDVTAVRSAFTVSMQKIIVEPVNLVVFITMLFIISWQLSLLALPLIPLAALFTTRLGKSLRKRSRRTTEQIAGLMNVLQENLQGIRIIKSFVREKDEIKRFGEENQRYYRSVHRRFSVRHLNTPINEMIGVAIGILLLWVGGQQVLIGRGVGPEEFMSYIIFMFAMLQPLRNLANVNTSIQIGLASAERIFRVLDIPPAIVNKDNAIVLDAFKDAIRFEDVTFHYDDMDRPALFNITTEIKRGSVVALVGSSGAGKSTFVDLIPRFYDATTGRITIDGRDVRDLDVDSLRHCIGMVTQQVLLFNCSVRENILYGAPGAGDDEIIQALEAAHAWQFVQEMPAGLASIIGEHGDKLSGGQRQRLAIARALLKNPPILILDEATSALDTESEQAVQEAISELIQDRTVVVIAHRLSTIQHADKIIVFSRGRISESGNHADLMTNGGDYSRLYKLQFPASESTFSH